MINIILVSYAGQHPHEDSGDSVAAGHGCVQKHREVHQCECQSTYTVADYCLNHPGSGNGGGSVYRTGVEGRA